MKILGLFSQDSSRCYCSDAKYSKKEGASTTKQGLEHNIGGAVLMYI